MLKKVVCGARGAESKSLCLKVAQQKNRPHKSEAVNKSGYPRMSGDEVSH